MPSKYTMVENIIKELLFEHDCVIIPGFGGFIANYAHADIHPVKHTMLPPHKKLGFNELLKSNDGLLINELSIAEDVSKEEAQEQVEAFVKDIKGALDEQKQVLIEGLGKFYLNDEQNIQFEPDNKENYLEESFALPELHFKPIEREEDTMKRVHPAQSRQAVRRAPVRRKPTSQDPKKKKPEPKAKAKKEATGEDGEKKKSKAIFIIIPAILLVLGGAVAALYYIEDGKYYNKMMASLGGAPQGESDLSDVQEAGVDSAGADMEGTATESEEESRETAVAEGTSDDDGGEEEENPFLPSSDDESSSSGTISSNGERFHVIGGVFAQKSNARKLTRKFSDAEILEIDGYYKVSVANFSSEAEAEAALDGMKGTYGSDIWVTPYK